MNDTTAGQTHAQRGASHVATGDSFGGDSRLAYIACHAISAGKNLAVFAGILWLAYTLKSGWVLWALLLCPWSKYKHDFKGLKRSSPNVKAEPREGKAR